MQTFDAAVPAAMSNAYNLDFKTMPAYCRYLLEHKLEEFSTLSLRLSIQANLPMLRFFKQMLESTPELEVVKMGMESNGIMLRAFAENNVQSFIDKSVDDWINNRITGLDRGQVEVEDITLTCYVRKRVFLSLLPGFSSDQDVLRNVTDELDRFTVALESACFKTYGDLLTEKLQRNESLYKQAQAISHLGNWTWNISTNSVEWTDELYRIYGLTPQSERITFERFMNFLHPDDREKAASLIQQSMQTGEPFEFVHRLVRDTGDIRLMLAKGEPTRNSDGTVSGMVGTGQDITEDTERTRAEAKLRESEERFRSLADSAPVMIWMATPTGERNYYNKTWLAYTGATIKEAEGWGWETFMHPDDLESFKRTYQTSFEQQQPFSAEYRLKRNDGEYRWMLSSGVPRYQANGEYVGFIGTVIDIDERKRVRELLEQKVQERTAELQRLNRELERSNAELLSFSYVASHDLQEPLRKIQTFSSRILDREFDNLSQAGREAFDRIGASAARMKQLIEDLLSYSRTNTSSKIFESVDLNNVLKEYLANQKEMLAEKNVSIDSDKLPTVNGISFQLYQLFENLIGNAVKYATPGLKPLVRIRYDLVNGSAVENAHAVSGKYHRIRISDNGIGFEQKHAEKIFEVFQRLHHRDQYPGTGIGLSICKRIVDNHNGFITAQSEIGKGATFDVFLPLQKL